jgi:hypothetical protein
VQDLTRKDVYDTISGFSTDQVNRFLRSADAKRFFRTIRSSPEFWEQKKRNCFAMLRQLGNPTFFITLSPAEVKWPELIMLLKFVLDKQTITLEQALSMSVEEKKQLIRRDPVTTARYFENRMRLLLNYITNDKVGPFCEHPIVDFYWRIEFQTRGSPHLHMIVWCKNAPVYEPNNAQSHEACVQFVDKYITAFVPEDGYVQDDMNSNIRVDINLLRHKHYGGKFNCRRDRWNDNDLFEAEMENIAEEYDLENSSSEYNTEESDADSDDEVFARKRKQPKSFVCKRNFPWPILNDTIILEPYSKEQRKNKSSEAFRTYAKIFIQPYGFHVC